VAGDNVKVNSKSLGIFQYCLGAENIFGEKVLNESAIEAKISCADSSFSQVANMRMNNFTFAS
jgi:hypothetical protein